MNGKINECMYYFSFSLPSEWQRGMSSCPPCSTERQWEVTEAPVPSGSSFQYQVWSQHKGHEKMTHLIHYYLNPLRTKTLPFRLKHLKVRKWLRAMALPEDPQSSSIPGNLVKTTFLALHHTYWTRDSGGGTSNLFLSKPSRSFWCKLKFKNHWPGGPQSLVLHPTPTYIPSKVPFYFVSFYLSLLM